MPDNRDYFVFDSQGNMLGKEDGKAPVESATVVYKAQTIAHENHGDAKPLRALVMTHGKDSRDLLQALAAAGMQSYVAYTDDEASLPYIKSATGKVRIGEKYSDGLFCNAFCVLNAARACSADVIMLADASRILGEVDMFIAYAESEGMPVFRTMSETQPALGWTACTTTARVPENDEWRVCPHCGLTFSNAAIAKHYYTCPTCGGYFRMSSDQRINDMLDIDSFTECACDAEETDPLSFPGYLEKLENLSNRTGLSEAVRTGEGTIAGMRAMFAFMDSSFLMGSMGSVVGERIAHAIDVATMKRLPMIIFCASGGARMQEGLVSLMQMAKISCALQRHAQAKLLYVSVITDPTTGGVTASFATQADIILAEPKALMGFAGKRVIQDTIKQQLPEGFQTAEFALEHGLIDAIVARNKLRSTLAHILAMHASSASTAHHGDGLEVGAQDTLVSYQAVCRNLEFGRNTYNHITYGRIPILDAPDGKEHSLIDIVLAKFVDRDGSGIQQIKRFWQSEQDGLDSKYTHVEGSGDGKAADGGAADAWERVRRARNTKRPTSQYYIDKLFDGFIEFHGDRMFADDGAVIGGIAWFGEQVVTVVALEKGRDVKERVKRNFGSPQPEGYRKTLRLMRQAEKFGRPIICLVDTQGAFCGADAEARGQGNAIAENLFELAGIKVPVISVLIGEGGSGGALALALSNVVGIQENAVYSVLSPEGFASILWKDRSRVGEAAAMMRMGAEDILSMGIVDEVISEGDGPAHENPEQAAENVESFLARSLKSFAGIDGLKLVEQRQQRFARF